MLKELSKNTVYLLQNVEHLLTQGKTKHKQKSIQMISSNMFYVGLYKTKLKCNILGQPYHFNLSHIPLTGLPTLDDRDARETADAHRCKETTSHSKFSLITALCDSKIFPVSLWSAKLNSMCNQLRVRGYHMKQSQNIIFM